VELSQKFSTLTDGKFYNQEEVVENNHNQDEIEENIEMETNSLYSTTNRKEVEEPTKIGNITQFNHEIT